VSTVIYGIKNCDTMKKAMTWLDEKQIPYSFHDYKKEGVSETLIKRAIKEHGWESVINRRGTTWRKLPDNVKETMAADSALKIALENASIIKRPLLEHKGSIYLGFDAQSYRDIFA
jgi:arsenate reductase